MSVSRLKLRNTTGECMLHAAVLTPFFAVKLYTVYGSSTLVQQAVACMACDLLLLGTVGTQLKKPGVLCVVCVLIVLPSLSETCFKHMGALHQSLAAMMMINQQHHSWHMYLSIMRRT